MNPEHPPQTPPEREDKTRLVRFLLPVIVVIISAALAFGMMKSGPKAKPRPKQRNAVLVDVRPIEFGSHATTVNVMGTVKPQREVVLRPQVSGEIIKMSKRLVPGGRFNAGDELLAVERRDYELVVTQLASEVAKVEADLQMELGRRRVAEKEYELLGEAVSAEERALMLREPQLASTRALLAGAKARFKQAELNLARTTVSAPFNAVVMSREINLGTRVSPATPLVTLVGSDSYWIEAPIPASQLKWINTGQQQSAPGSPVRVYDSVSQSAADYRSGHLVGLTARVEENGRMARLLAEVPDPLALKATSPKQPRLLLGSYVRVEIEGKTLARAAAIERDLIRDGDKLWIMDDQGRLDIRTVEIDFHGRDQVLVGGGVLEGEQLITSNLASPVQGMALRLKGEQATPADTEKTKP